MENSIASPSPDGGAAIANEYGSVLGTEDSAICANPARNFLNEDSCFLSDTPTACSYRETKAKKSRQTQGNLTESDVASVFEVTLDKLQAVYELTGSGEDGTVVSVMPVFGIGIVLCFPFDAKRLTVHVAAGHSIFML